MNSVLPRELIFEILSYDLKAVWQAHRRLSQKVHLEADELEIFQEFRDLLLRSRVLYYDFDVVHQIRLWSPIFRPKAIVFLGDLSESKFPMPISKFSKSALVIRGKITDNNCNHKFGFWMKNCHTLAFLGQVNSERSKQHFLQILAVFVELKAFRSLKRLVLWGNYLKDSDMWEIAPKLGELKKLKIIDVRHNPIGDQWESTMTLLRDNSFNSQKDELTIPCRECKMVNFVGDNLKCTKCHHVFCDIKCLFINRPCASCKSQGRCGQCCAKWSQCICCHNCSDGTVCVECYRPVCFRCVVLKGTKPSAFTCKNCRVTYCSTCAGFQSSEATSDCCCETCWTFNFENSPNKETLLPIKKHKLEIGLQASEATFDSSGDTSVPNKKHKLEVGS